MNHKSQDVKFLSTCQSVPGILGKDAELYLYSALSKSAV